MKWAERLDFLWMLIVALMIWRLLSAWAGPEALPGPLGTLHQAKSLVLSSTFWDNAASTFVAFAYAFAIAATLGVALGLWLGFSPFLAEVFSPILNSLYAIPKIALYPVILLFFGLGRPAEVAFGVAHGVFPVIMFTMNGVLTLKPVIRKTARILRLSQIQSILFICIPAAVPEIVSGLRIGFALTMLGVLIGELFASTRGLGFLLMQAANQQDMRTTMAVVVMLLVMAAAVGAGMLAVDDRLRRGSGRRRG